MSDLKFPHDSLDLIWSEGAIYIIEFEHGINYWKKFLKTGGIMAVTEVIWTEDDPPQQIKHFWESEYPFISGIEKKLSRYQTAD